MGRRFGQTDHLDQLFIVTRDPTGVRRLLDRLCQVVPSREAIVTDPINSLDTSSLSERDRLEIEKLRAAYDRAGPRAVAEGMARLAETHPDLLMWLIGNLGK